MCRYLCYTVIVIASLSNGLLNFWVANLPSTPMIPRRETMMVTEKEKRGCRFQAQLSLVWKLVREFPWTSKGVGSAPHCETWSLCNTRSNHSQPLSTSISKSKARNLNSSTKGWFLRSHLWVNWAGFIETHYFWKQAPNSYDSTYTRKSGNSSVRQHRKMNLKEFRLTFSIGIAILLL